MDPRRLLTFREVARRARVSEAAPYWHFASKEALLAGVAEQGFVTLAGLMAEVRRRVGLDRDAIKGAVAAGGVEGQEGHLVDALAPRGDEGRGTLRKALGSREQAVIRGSPNGATPSFMEDPPLNP